LAMKFVAGGAFVLGVIVATLVIIDLARTPPTPRPGQCALQDNLILPDRCVSSCPSGVDCPTTMTRRYFWFWTEAAGCPDGVICG
jgi:hypothetical protein